MVISPDLETLIGAPVAMSELKSRPGRRQTHRAVGPRGAAIVKVYASGRASVVAARVAAMSGGPSEPAVPRVLLLDPALGMVVLSEMSGVPLRVALLDGDIGASRRAGTAVGAWHRHWTGIAPPALRPHTHQRELEILAEHSGRAPTTIRAAVGAALVELAEGEWTPATVVHRDLYEEQVLIGDKVSLIDLDDAALGPPELDVGNLLAHLVLLARRHGRDLSAMADAFLEGYGSTGPRLDAAMLARCRSLTLLRLACIHRDGDLVDLAGAVPAR